MHGNGNVRKKRDRFAGSIGVTTTEMETFKGAAARASCGLGPLRDSMAALLEKGMKAEMARITLAPRSRPLP